MAKTKAKKNLNQKYYKSYWNENMIDYLYHSAGSRWFDYLLTKMLDQIDSKKVKSVADVGCGVGNKTALMAKYFPKAKVTGYDFSDEGVAAANAVHAKDQKNLTYKTEDITKKKQSQKIDLITAFDVLEHIDDWEPVADSLVKSNSRYMLISSPVGRMRPYEVHIGHFRNYKRGELEAFFESRGYKTVKTFYAGFPFYSPILRNLTNMFYKDYAELPQAKMSFLSKRWHDIWFVLFRYLSMKSRGDNFIGLFEKKPNTKSK